MISASDPVIRATMPRNVEIKAYARGLDRIEAELRGLGLSPQRLVQRDTFFGCTSGRLKLREEEAAAELIFYSRGDDVAARESRYWRCPVHDPSGILATLGVALGILGVVHKVRRCFIVGQTRVHLDDVARLGEFVELEVVLTEDQTIEDGEREAAKLMSKLGIDATDLVGPAYVDLLQRNDAANSGHSAGLATNN